MGGRSGSLGSSQGITASPQTKTVPAPAAAAAPQAAPAVQAAPAAATAQTAQTAQAAPAQAAPAAQQSGPPTGANGFSHLTTQQANSLERAAQQQMQQDPALAAGVSDYINPTMQSNGKAISQNANWKMATGGKLNAREQRMMDSIDTLAQPIGVETTLYRADHSDFLSRYCNLPQNYNHMNDAQLRQKLVGKQWVSTSLESTAYDSRNNPFWPQQNGSRSSGVSGQGGSNSGNREVLIRYHTAKSTRAAFIQHSQSEAVLAVGTHHKITGVRSTKLGPSRTYLGGKKVIELEVEVW